MHWLSNMICNIKVAYIGKKVKTVAPNSKVCINILSILYKLGYIRGFSIVNKKEVVVLLKYHLNKSVIKNIGVVSTPGRRVYYDNKKLKNLISKKDHGFYIISTSKGVLTDEEAFNFNVGGEVLLKIS